MRPFPIARLLRFTGILLLVSSLFALAACKGDNSSSGPEKGAPAEDPKKGDAIIMGSIGEPNTLLPVLASDSASSDIIGLVFNGLVRYDKNLQIEGELAKSWEISEDQLTITFHLLEGVKWHDGAPLTAEDVLFTYQLYVNPEIPTAYAERYKQVVEAKVLDPLTFQVRYEKPLASALISWALAIHPKHLLEGKDVATSDFARAPIGSGPYRFDRWEAGKQVVLKANPDYFEGEPNIREVRYRIIPDQSTMFLELKSGGIDMMSLTPLQYAKRAESEEFRAKFNMYRYVASAYTYLGFNLKNPLFQDRRLRIALAHAIDRQELIDGVLMGLGSAAVGPYKPGTWSFNEQLTGYAYDPAKAKELLAESGWKDSDGDGILDRDGAPLGFTIMTNQGNDQRIKSAEIIQRRLKEVGIDVKIRVIEWAAFLKEFIDPGNFEAIIMGWTIPPDPDAYNVWHSSKTAPGELNFVGFQNAEVDELLEKGRRILKEEERKPIYDRFQEILQDEQPYVFLYVPDALPVLSSRFKGIEPAPAGIMHNFIEWYVPPAERKYRQGL